MVISSPPPPPPRQFVREMPLLVVLLSLLMKLQFINQKKKVDVQPYCIKALFVLKLLFFCSNFMLPIYRAFVQIVCVCVCVCACALPIYKGSHSNCVCVCGCVCASHTQGLSFRLCVCVALKILLLGDLKI